MKTIAKIGALIALSISLTTANSQVKNIKTDNIKVYGNCSMCASNIEKAGNQKKIAQVQWNEDTQIAKLTYDSTKTNREEILKRIALAGYDNDEYLAPDNAYAALDDCCQYERLHKSASTAVLKEHATVNIMKTKETALETVYNHYFATKDALVQSNALLTGSNAKKLKESIMAIHMETLTDKEHLVWMQVKESLTSDVHQISESKSLDHQRKYMMRLSKNIYPLIKVSKIDTPVYYQFCPMANEGKGANWLSKEKNIKNPYYGAQMMTCGSTIETID